MTAYGVFDFREFLYLSKARSGSMQKSALGSTNTSYHTRTLTYLTIVSDIDPMPSDLQQLHRQFLVDVVVCHVPQHQSCSNPMKQSSSPSANKMLNFRIVPPSPGCN